MLRLEEYQAISNIMDRICDIQFLVETAEDSEDSPEEDVFSLTDADKEDMFSRSLSEVGADWIRAIVRLTEAQDNRTRAQKLIEMFELPICQTVKPRILAEEDLSQEVFSDMITILEEKVADLEAFVEKKFQKDVYSCEKYKLCLLIEKKKEMLLDIRVKCLNTISTGRKQSVSKLTDSWKIVREGIKWLSYEKYIDDQPEIDEIQDICETLIKSGQLEQENWEVRKRVLKDIIRNDYYDYYNCGDVMAELAGKLCTNKEEHLACADIMDATDKYKEKAAYLYHQYGRDDKYVSYLETHLDRTSKEYSALITYYQEHNQQENACRVAKLGLERCKEDLTDIFICLLLDSQKDSDQEYFKKLYASAKRRKHVNLDMINSALENNLYNG